MLRFAAVVAASSLALVAHAGNWVAVGPADARDALVATHKLEWHWVKGHSGNVGNERVDALANRAIDALMAR